MIVLLTARGHGYTLKSLTDGTAGAPMPPVEMVDYNAVFSGEQATLQRATYIFGDIERLAPWELRLAAQLYRALKAQGLRCLNDPAKAMARVELLTALHAAKINPFTVYRADAQPRPKRFPVFIREENSHSKPSGRVYGNQQELDDALRLVRERGFPLRGLLVVEQVSEPYQEGLWGKWGTWRIGEQTIVEHLVLDTQWLVKDGAFLRLDEAAVENEHDAITTNRFAAAIEPAFAIGGIEFGRADHGGFRGRQIVYEINTNPYLSMYIEDPRPKRASSLKHARVRIGEALEAIDCAESGWLRIDLLKGRERP